MPSIVDREQRIEQLKETIRRKYARKLPETGKMIPETEPQPTEEPTQEPTQKLPTPSQELPVRRIQEESPFPWQIPQTPFRTPEKPVKVSEPEFANYVPEAAEPPWYKKVFEPIGKGFEWVQENLEKPWAATILSPFSPDLTWREGENWLEHEKREYDAWKAPKFVKGAAEFSMPLWWLPYFGWSAKGASLIPRIGGALGKGILTAEKVMALPITLPVKALGKGATRILKFPPLEKMRQDVFKADRFRFLAEKLIKMPGMRPVIGAINPSATVRSQYTTEQLVREGKVLYGGMREFGDNAVNVIMAQLETHGTAPQIKKAFGFDDMMRSSIVTPKKEGLPSNFWDIFSNPKQYNLTKVQSEYIDDYWKILDDVLKYAEDEIGIKINKLEFQESMHYIPRVWKGRTGILDAKTGIFRPVGTQYQPETWEKIVEVPFRAGVPKGIGSKAFFEKPRIYEMAEEALAAGVIPSGIGPSETMHTWLSGMYRRMTDQITANELKPLGKTLKELIPQGIRVAVDESAKTYRGLSKLTNAIPRAKRGEAIPTQTIKAIERVNPELAQELRSTLTLRGEARLTELNRLSKTANTVKKQAWDEYTAARNVRKRSYDIARTKPGWSAVGQPFASGRLFPEPVAKELTKMMADRGNPIFTKLSNVNALSRFMVTGFDFGAGLIQGIPLLMSNPAKWGKAMKLSVESFFKPEIRAKYLTENIDILQKLVPEGLLVGNSEYMQAITSGGILGKAPVRALELSGAQRFATAFNTFGDAARVEWAKALLPMAEREGSLRELSAFLNEATGVMSSRALGVGATQREVEGAVLLFAPRYFRANMALWTDVMRGGLRGDLARDAMTSMIMGTFFWYYGLAKSLGQEPNLDPTTGKFLTVKIGDQHIGFGSMQIALMRLLGNTYKTATENPQDFLKLSTKDNPVVKFTRSRVAPITGSTWDILTGKTFIGEPIDDPLDVGREVVAQRLLPFWLSGYVSDYPRPGLAGVPSEIFGARTWPLQLWERRDELGEQYARQEFGKPWRSTKDEVGITKLEKKQLEEKYPDLVSLTEEVEAQRAERVSGADEEAWLEFQRERKAAKSVQRERFDAIQGGVETGELDGFEAKELIQKANDELRAKYKHIQANPQYSDVMEFLDQPMTAEQMQNTPIEDIAFDTYMSLIYSNEMTTPTGEYDYAKRDRAEEWFVSSFGEDMLGYVKELLSTGQELPPIVQEYYKAQEVLREYWGFKDWWISKFGEPQTQYQTKRMEAWISSERKNLRRRNPEVDKYYTMFYTRLK